MNENWKPLIELALLHLAESTLFALLLLLLVFAFRLQNAGNRFFFHHLALLKFLLPVGAVAAILFRSSDLAPTYLGEFALSTVSDSSRYIATRASSSLAAIASAAWIAGVLLLGALRTIAIIRSHRLASKPDRRDSAQTSRLRQSLARANQPDFPTIESEQVASLGLIGFFRPRIIVNAAFLGTLTDKELNAAVLHELAHARRRDNLWRIVHELAVTIFWFHPIVWLLRHRLRAESELACDESALSQGEEPQTYAECLLKAASLNDRYTNVWMTRFSAASLKERIRKIIAFENKKESNMKLLTIHLAIICVLGLAAATSSQLYAATGALAPHADNVYNLNDLDKTPKPVSRTSPKYPETLKQQSIPGWVVVEWIIDETGTVLHPSAVESSNREFESSAIASILDSQWLPGEKNGSPVKVRLRQKIEYKP